MEKAQHTIALMWKGAAQQCYVRKRGEDWILTVEGDGQILKEAKVESPGEAIRLSEDLRRTLRTAS